MTMVMHASQCLDVIITAGDRRGSLPVLGQNKALLRIAGIPLIHYVLSAVERARCTARIFVVGDKARLQQLLQEPNAPFRGTRPLVLLEQGNTLYDNIWTAFLHTLPDYTPGTDWRVYSETAAADKAVLVMPGDIPLATPFEIDEFVDGCDLSRYDYCLGLTAESTLRAYYAHDGRPGIQMACYALRDLQVRQNNLHLVKPLRLGNRHHIQKMYDLRYQREWYNIVKLCWELWRARDASLRMVWSFLCLHVARLITRFGWQRTLLSRPFFLELPMVASLMSQLLRTRFTTVITRYGGCTLDIDNAEHYDAICANFDYWLAYQHALEKELKQQD
jgi:GTP:adenosylcobinamide-phosphate guanylyltransferase